MPAIRSAASTSILVDATAQRTLMAQYRADLANASINFNPTTQHYSRGSQRMIPYPSSEDVFLRSNHAVNEDDDFADISLPDELPTAQPTWDEGRTVGAEGGGSLVVQWW